MKRQEAERRGRRAEAVAAWWLRLWGWRILDRRVRTPLGEVDLVARRGRTVAFVEVKSRARPVDLALAVDRNRLMRVANAAHMLSHRFADRRDVIRIDVVLVGPWQLPVHLKNVWHG